MKIPCRGCGTLLDLSDTGCQICMRGRSPQEIANDARRLKEAQRQRKLLPWKVLGLLLLLGAGGWLFTRFQDPLARAYALISGKLSGAVEKMQDPRYYANRTGPADAPSPPAPAPATSQAPSPPAPGGASGAPSRAPHPPGAEHQAAPAPAEAPREPTWELPPPPDGHMPSHWLVRGFVYDLATARPLAAARVRFVAVEDEAHQATVETDRDGYYHLLLPRQRNYRTMVLAKGYRSFPLEDGDPPYRSMKAAARRKVLAEALEYTSDAATLGWNENFDEIRQDFAVVAEPAPAR